MDRQAELVRQEALRRRAFAEVDEPRRLEHMEVADALIAASKLLERRAKHCSLETKYASRRRRSAEKKRAHCRGKCPYRAR